MKKLFFAVVFTVFSACVFYSCGPTDLELQSKVKGEMLVNYPLVNSSVRSAIVSLSGTVETDEDKAGAEELAKSIEGIKSVVNEINVVPPPAPDPDVLLKEAIQKLYKNEKITGINSVTVKDSMVTLVGSVNKADLKKITEITKAIGAKKVYTDYLKTK